MRAAHARPALGAVRSGVAAGCTAAFFALASWGYDPQRGAARGVAR